MGEKVGRSLSLSLPRRFVGDLLHFAQKVPTVPVQRRMNISPLVAARTRLFRARVGARSSPRPSLWWRLAVPTCAELI